MDFRIVYLLKDYWVAGVQNLRMPVSLRKGFGPRESMSFFLYNQDGHQAIARPYLDGRVSTGEIGPSPTDDHWDMPKYYELDRWDVETNAPSSNFIYAFDVYRFFVCDQWEEVYAHDADGNPQYGSIENLADASMEGCEIKVAISGLCCRLNTVDDAMEHQVFVHGGSIITLKKNISLLLLIHWFVLDPIFPCVMPADHGISVGLTPVVMVTSTVGCVIPTHSNSVVNKDIMLCAGSLVNRDDFLTQLGR